MELERNYLNLLHKEHWNMQVSKIERIYNQQVNRNYQSLQENYSQIKPTASCRLIIIFGCHFQSTMFVIFEPVKSLRVNIEKQKIDI